MELRNIGFHYQHDENFWTNRPTGSGDYLLLLIQTPAKMKLSGGLLHVPKDTLLLYRKGTPQFYGADGEPFENDWFHFDGTDAGEFLEQLSIPLDTPVKLSNPALFSLLIKNLADEAFSASGHKARIVSCLLEHFFLKLADELSLPPNALGARYGAFSSLRCSIYGSPSSKWSVPEAAKSLSLSTGYFQHLYQQFFGVSCMEDIIESRISYAKYYLRQTELPVGQIALLCGYESEVHFLRQFKRRTGETPTEYRKIRG